MPAPLLPLAVLLATAAVVGLVTGPSLPPPPPSPPAEEPGSHPGVCPNHLNPHLWVDAQSTCERECLGDQDCAAPERCCPNVCGLRSCVAARFGPGEPTAPAAASCEGFVCQQQGSDCDIWDGQPVCRCRERCGKEPSFTCASDGLTYYNRCYLDAEACLRGLRLRVVPCKSVLGWPSSSPGPPDVPETPETTVRPTHGVVSEAPEPPALYSNPSPQVVVVGGTASLHCDVSGRPPPAITWERQSEQQDNLILRPDQMYGNVVVTSIGQLVLYNARPEDAGLYTCTAHNAAGLLRADFPLSVVQRGPAAETSPRAPGVPTPVDCAPVPDTQPCASLAVPRVLWRFDPQRGGCATFGMGGCEGAWGGFETYDACQRACAPGPGDTCVLPAVRGPCPGHESRWAYSPLLRQCHPFVYGGCEGNGNNFENREACEDACPVPRTQPCGVCRLRSRLALSLCRSDFAIVGRLTEVLQDPEAAGGGGIARVALDDVLKDDKMGLQFFGTKYLEVTLLGVDWTCPCPNVTAGDGPLVIMGEVRDGVAVLDAGSYVRAASEKRVRKIVELIEKKACELLNRFQD
ncbi:PREDICTED: WAP, Kazal, immunoglobulin, Kunitz and NTR domain-containing protein 1 [Chrysochloris asiatica]|uniref:WAP, Kazal, immunoglobulin, Kunitz and NTR domain-containing protein 1 n=1 Tax=Chrysochloris asiatica TaxID=185453 RepID=UPI0003F10E42|nr:PREDICTED: WAP, Kazal, immunoglobulin, Kunitz and NTR domain-containing protein 1 [Chrysochloris asiatica]